MLFESFPHIKCPSCSEVSSLRKSRPKNTKERLYRATRLVEYYRCRKCGWRGWKINWSLSSKAIHKIVIYVLLALLSAFIVYNLLKLIA